MKRAELQKTFAEEDREQRKAVLGALLEHEGGRKFLWWLLTISRYGTQPFATNALSMSFGCGEMNVANKIVAELIEAAPKGLPTLMVENAERQRERQDALEDADPDDV